MLVSSWVVLDTSRGVYILCRATRSETDSGATKPRQLKGTTLSEQLWIRRQRLSRMIGQRLVSVVTDELSDLESCSNPC